MNQNYCLVLIALAESVASFKLENIADGTEELLDLSLEFSDSIPYWPTIEKKGENFKIREVLKGHSPRFGYFYNADYFSTSDHGGTHVDAFKHVNVVDVKDAGIDKTPLRHFFGTAAVVDITAKCAANPDYELTKQDLRDWESSHGNLPENSLLFINTGWAKKIHDKSAYWGTANYFDITQLHYPGIGGAAAEWLVKYRKIKAVGIDTTCMDSGKNGLDLKAHSMFLSNGVSVIEMVQNLDKMPPKGAFVFGLPMKIKASGSPIRLVAVGWKKPGGNM